MDRREKSQYLGFFSFDYDFFYSALKKCFEKNVTSFVDDKFEILQLCNIFFL